MSNTTKKIDRAARKLCTHTIVFTDSTDKLCAVRAMQGRSTKAIAAELGITLSEAQYRIIKAQKSLNTRFRRDYRNGDGAVVRKMMKVTEGIGMSCVERQIAPKFTPFARAGVPRSG